MGELSDFDVGQTVELQDGRIAKVQYIGNTHFAGGDWLGVELEDASGKNDGAVLGQRYFDCKPGYGMFVRPAVAAAINQPTPRQNDRDHGKANGAAVKSRPQSITVAGLRRQSVMDSGTMKRQSINAGSPTPGGRTVPTSRRGSPSKSPTKQLSSTSSSGIGTPPNTTDSTTRKNSTTGVSVRGLSMGPPPPLSTNARPLHQSGVGTMNGPSKAPGHVSSSSSRAPNRLSLRPGATKRFSSVGGEARVSASNGQRSPADSVEPDLLSPKTAGSQDDQPKRTTSSILKRPSVPDISRGLEKPSSRGRSPPSSSQRAPLASSATHREVEDLKIKLRIMEKKRIEDRDKLKSLERLQAERDKFEGIIQKLQTKYQPLQQEIMDLKGQLKEEVARFAELEVQQAENETVVEVAALDREMAEETAESLKMELDALRQKHEEIELEVEILREENQELGKEMSPEEKTSQGWLQMERSNERLREALMRLRDMTQEQEADLKNQVAELEKDVLDLKAVKEEYLQTKERLVQSESVVEELRQQLDTALGAEEMIEELTEKNFALNEQIDDLKAAVEDLESLKELNDELDLNHTENEKQLQEEIDYNESIRAEQSRKSALQEETIQDLEYTVSRFRDLVTNMQSDLEDMRASQQITETEANDMTSRSRAMMDLNMRLQISASKAQVKAIDLELRRLEAKEAMEHLEIVRLFLPESFKTERSSVLAFLSFKRIGFKASMMHNFIKERISGQPSPGHEDDVLISCDILDKLVWISSTCERFVKSIQSFTVEAFGRLEGALYELEPVERAFNGWIEGLRKDELKEEQCAAELQRSIALMTHLGEIHIGADLERYADDIHMRAFMMQSYLENTAAVLFQIKTMAQNKMASVGEEGIDQEMLGFLRKADLLIMQTRSAKVIISKAVRQIEELTSRSLTLDQSTLPAVEQCQKSAFDLASSVRSIGLSLFRLLNEEGRNTPFTFQEISNAISSSDVQPLSSLSSKIHANTTQMQIFYNLTNSLTQIVEFPAPPPPPPWQLLAQKMHAANTMSTTHETEIHRLKDEMVERNIALAVRDRLVEEMSVKVEVLEKRVGESSGRREKVRELEGMVDKAKVKEKSLLNHLKHLEANLQTLETERETWRKSSHLQKRPSSSQILPPAAETSTPHKIAVLETEIRSLQSSIRYLRSTSSTHYLPNSLAFLSTPVRSQTPQPRPLKSEAVDVLKELVNLVTRPESRLLAIRATEKDERLKWKPARETSPWALARQRREWEGWKEWEDGIGKRMTCAGRERGRKRGYVEKSVATRMEGGVKIGAGGELMIAGTGDWDGVSEAIGIYGDEVLY